MGDEVKSTRERLSQLNKKFNLFCSDSDDDVGNGIIGTNFISADTSKRVSGRDSAALHDAAASRLCNIFTPATSSPPNVPPSPPVAPKVTQERGKLRGRKAGKQKKNPNHRDSYWKRKAHHYRDRLKSAKSENVALKASVVELESKVKSLELRLLKEQQNNNSSPTARNDDDDLSVRLLSPAFSQSPPTRLQRRKSSTISSISWDESDCEPESESGFDLSFNIHESVDWDDEDDGIHGRVHSRESERAAAASHEEGEKITKTRGAANAMDAAPPVATSPSSFDGSAFNDARLNAWVAHCSSESSKRVNLGNLLRTLDSVLPPSFQHAGESPPRLLSLPAVTSKDGDADTVASVLEKQKKAERRCWKLWMRALHPDKMGRARKLCKSNDGALHQLQPPSHEEQMYCKSIFTILAGASEGYF